jgi:hypothetical protein
LAHELKMTVSELLSKLDSVEISEWIAFFSIENETEDDKKKESLTDRLKAALSTKVKDGWKRQK